METGYVLAVRAAPPLTAPEKMQVCFHGSPQLLPPTSELWVLLKFDSCLSLVVCAPARPSGNPSCRKRDRATKAVCSISLSFTWCDMQVDDTLISTTIHVNLKPV